MHQIPKGNIQLSASISNKNTMATQVLYTSPELLEEYLQQWGPLLHDSRFVPLHEGLLN